MIQQAIDAIADAIDANLAAAMSVLPDSGKIGLARGAELLVSRTLIDDSKMAGVPIGIQVEQIGEVTQPIPYEAQDELPVVPIGVKHWLVQPKIAALRDADEYAMVRASRALDRAIRTAIIMAFQQVAVMDMEGVQIRRPAELAPGIPEQGEDESVTTALITMSVPALDYVALSAGGL